MWKKTTRSSRGTEAFVAILFVLLPLLLAAIPQPFEKQTIRIGPDLVVEEAVFGYVDPSSGAIVPSKRIDTAKYPGFAWRVKLSGRQRTLHFREEFILPAPAQTWQVGNQTIVAPDRASAATEGDWRLESDMEIRNGWIHTAGDPKGNHVMRVWLDGVLVREFDFVLY